MSRLVSLRHVIAVVCALGLAACEETPPTPPAGAEPQTPSDATGQTSRGPAPFADITDPSGMRFVHENGRSDQRYMPEIMGAGAALFDVDGDGDLDVYLLQGGPLDDPAVPRQDVLMRNDLSAEGELRFTDITADAGIPADGYGMGVATGDVNGDGLADLYITNWGPNRLLLSRGDGTFEDITDAAGADDPAWSVPATFLDLDADGHLDLFVGNYVDFRLANHQDCFTATGASDYCSPLSYGSTRDRLLRNTGEDTFEDVSAAAGVRGIASKALGVITGDFNDDGRTDLYVANDGVANQLWVNQGDGTFQEDALFAGCAVNFEGAPEASMGVDAADVDGDGDEDIFMTHLRGETNTLYLNRGDAVFEDRTLRFGLAASSLSATGFGTAWLDVENDGLLDLLAVNGAVTVEEKLALAGDDFPYHQPNQLFRNVSAGDTLAFEAYTHDAQDPFARSEVSRGAAFGDLDNDGDTDVVITNNGGPARVLENRVGQDGDWIGLSLRVGPDQGYALGAAATVTLANGQQWLRRVRTAGSYVSANDPRLLFGLGARGSSPQDVTVTVRWVDGAREQFGPLPSQRYHTLVRGTGNTRP
ncbi:MAG: CRTAC1 family protein [Pseudomonadota bacterium]